MAADPKGTLRTPWAASVNDGEHLFTGDTKDDAIGAAMADLEDEIARGDCDAEPGAVVDVLLYRDVLWCDGSEVRDGECHCGSDHDDHEWMAVDWGEKSRETATVDPGLRVEAAHAR